ncbi:MAG: adenylyltransferase/cytidyltransferase family protein [bacterium]|nr:adenylyltransferase/cytidyltransferase family protein [bacterium]
MKLPHPSPLLIKEREKKKKVMAFGTFDVYHKGHENYLEQAKKLGEYLIVVVARDKNVLRIKKQETRNKEQKRKKILEESGLADEVALGDLKDKYKIIEKYRPDVIALGYDQKVDLVELKDKLKEFNLNAKIVRLKSYEPEIYKSSKLKK